jgi:hypothetical protein
MKAFITGGTGFVGTYIVRRLVVMGWDVVMTGRSGQSVHQKEPRVKIIACDTKIPGAWQEEVSSADIIINLAGKNIFTRWTKKNFQEIIDSRVLTTKNLVDAIPTDSNGIFLSTSAAGFYGNCGETRIDETMPAGEGVLARLCGQWEAEANKAEQKGCRTVNMRFGMVIGKGGGAMKMMIPPFRFFLGGSIGKGDNWVPWIHIDDLVEAVLFIIANTNVKGPVNFSAPDPVTHRGLTTALAGALKRPSVFTIPPFVIKTLMGGPGVELMSSQRLVPDKLQKNGFKFEFENIEQALSDLLGCKETGALK